MTPDLVEYHQVISVSFVTGGHWTGSIAYIGNTTSCGLFLSDYVAPEWLDSSIGAVRSTGHI